MREQRTAEPGRVTAGATSAPSDGFRTRFGGDVKPLRADAASPHARAAGGSAMGPRATGPGLGPSRCPCTAGSPRTPTSPSRTGPRRLPRRGARPRRHRASRPHRAAPPRARPRPARGVGAAGGPRRADARARGHGAARGPASPPPSPWPPPRALRRSRRSGRCGAPASAPSAPAPGGMPRRRLDRTWPRSARSARGRRGPRTQGSGRRANEVSSGSGPAARAGGVEARGSPGA